MPDKFSAETRSRIMSAVKSKNTYPERLFHQKIRGLGLRKHPNIHGNPDLGLKNRKIAVFIDGCFWHKCPKCYGAPKSNKGYWLPKLDVNVKRDRRINRQLKKEGYLVIRVWEHEIMNDAEKCTSKTIEKIKKEKITSPSKFSN